MEQGDRFINCVTLEIYTYQDTDNIGNIVMLNSEEDIRHVGEKYFTARYIPYSETECLKLKNNKLKERICCVCEKSIDDLE